MDALSEWMRRSVQYSSSHRSRNSATRKGVNWLGSVKLNHAVSRTESGRICNLSENLKLEVELLSESQVGLFGRANAGVAGFLRLHLTPNFVLLCLRYSFLSHHLTCDVATSEYADWRWWLSSSSKRLPSLTELQLTSRRGTSMWMSLISLKFAKLNQFFT